jgi:RND family efflux transporter MFP subunit
VNKGMVAGARAGACRARWVAVGFALSWAWAGGAYAQAPSVGLASADAAAPTRAVLDRNEIRAQLMPRRYTTLAAEIGAKINSLPIAEGAAFKSGETLVGFDCEMQKAQWGKARAEFESAEYTFRSNQRLLELNSVGQLEVDLARAALARAKAEMDANQVIVSKCAIAAPFSGRVAEQKAREQQFVQAGQPLLEIIDDSVLELEFLVPSSWLRWLRVGAPLRVQIDETRKTYPARFIRIGARVDPVSQSVKVVAAIEGQHAELMAGMSGRVTTHPSASTQVPGPAVR